MASVDARTVKPRRLTPTQMRALRWLAEHDGCAVPDGYGRLIAANGDRASFQAQTFLRLMISGHCCQHFRPGALGISMKGLNAVHQGIDI